jgi:hypothetical protein
MGTTQADITPRRQYRLFDAKAVAVAALICSPLGGAVLMGVNYGRLGRAGKGALAVLFGLLATVPAILITLNAKSSAASLAVTAMGILLFFCTWQIAIEVQGEAVEEHVATGGRLGSKWMALVVGIATLAVLYGLVCAVLLALQPRKVMVGSKDVVVYSGLATRGDAMALGDELRRSQYFQDRGATVVVHKGIGQRTLSFVVQEGSWNQAGVLSSIEETAREAAPTVGGLPVEVQLLDDRLDEEGKSTVGEACFGGDNCVYYEGTATEEEAEALGEGLKSVGFFRGNGASVLLIRHNGEGTTLAFVVRDEAWKNPQKVSEFETIVRDAAPELGGLPIVMHLVDAHSDVKTDELVE